MGDSREILKAALADLARVLSFLRVSSLYLTKPQDYEAQDDFCNLAVSGTFRGTPRELLEKIRLIETAHGRERTGKILKGPRTLDIDIVLFGDRIVHESDLVVPHERMDSRRFVLVPLLELEGGCTDPKTGEKYRDVLSRLPDQGVIKAGNLYGN